MTGKEVIKSKMEDSVKGEEEEMIKKSVIDTCFTAKYPSKYS